MTAKEDRKLMQSAPETDQLISSIERFLQRHREQPDRQMSMGVDAVLAGIREARSAAGDANADAHATQLANVASPAAKTSQPVTETARPSLPTLDPTRLDVLADALASLPQDGALANIARDLRKAQSNLVWRQDDNSFYPEGAALGDGYINSNLHSMLIGPDGCGHHHPDFTLGIFVLGPFTLYRDHRHPAPELYVNLSERTAWRLADGDWQDYGAGSIIWNSPRVLHATRVYDRPFISIFSWVRDVNLPCEVVPRDDWAAVEAELEDMKQAH